MIGTVPVYDAIGFYDKELSDITSKSSWMLLENAEDGVDLLPSCRINRTL